jgi:hypothetical protein
LGLLYAMQTFLLNVHFDCHDHLVSEDNYET